MMLQLIKGWTGHRIRTVALAGMFAVTGMHAAVAAGAESADNHIDTKLSRLAEHFATRGYEVAGYFSHPAFAIDETIGERFTGSAEATGIKAVREAEENGDPEQVFNEEFARYKRRIGFEAKQQNILPFIQQYGDLLEQSEHTYGIPAEVTAAIIGVESDYGAVTGKHYAFNVYVSMYMAEYRTDFALSQLEELLAFIEKKDMDIFSVKSSYAGAMGYMQFIPYSLNHWFVGEDIYDMGDTIASVANYLAHFHERRGSIERAVFSYNPSRLYTETVLELAAYAQSRRETHL